MIHVSDVAFLVHLFIIVFTILGTFSTNQETVILAFALQVSILVHWIVNNKVCVLTQIEKYLRNEPDDGNTFFGKVFEGVYDRRINSIVLFLLLMTSLYRIKSFGILFDRNGLRRVRG
jgi:hypothetical protein